MKWFRFYSEFRSDPKMRRMPIAHRYAFVVLLCLSSESSVRGEIIGLDDDDIAYELEMDKEDWLTLKAKFRSKGLIEFAGDRIIICNWDKRQFASDSSAERVARHREGKKKRPCNVTETEVKRHVTPSDTDTDPYSDSDTDTNPDPEKEKETANAVHAPQINREEKSISEPIEPVTTYPPVNPTGKTEPLTSSQFCRGDQGSGAAISLKEKKESRFEQMRQTYNDRKPVRWPEMQSVGSKRQKKLEELIKECGSFDNALAALGNALDFAAIDPWYSTKDLTFENFASNGKILQLHERQISKLAGSPGQSAVMTEANIRLMQQYQHCANVFGVQL